MSAATERLARRVLARVDALDVPRMPDPHAEPPSPLEFALDAGFEPDKWQEDVLTSTSRKIILCCSRQAGKSTVTGLAATYDATYKPGSLVLILAPALRQSSELFRKVMHLLRGLPDAPEIVMESALRVELSNGSRIIALPGSESTTRGYSAATLVIVDEASRIDNELITAVRPMLATTNGRLIALSTPAGRRGWFHDTWTQGEGWHRAMVKATDVSRISPEFLAEQRRELGEYMFAQEYMCEFVDAETSVFSSDLIERALTTDVEPLWRVAA